MNANNRHGDYRLIAKQEDVDWVTSSLSTLQVCDRVIARPDQAVNTCVGLSFNLERPGSLTFSSSFGAFSHNPLYIEWNGEEPQWHLRIFCPLAPL